MCRTMQTEVHMRFWSLCAILQKLPWAWSAAGFIALRCVTAGMGLMISGGAKMTITEQQGPEPEWWEKQTGWRKDGAPTNLFLIPGNRVVSSSNNNLQTTQRWLLIGRLIRYSHSRAITVKKRKQKGETTSVLRLTTQSWFAVHTDTPLLTGRQQLWLHSLYSSHPQGRRADSIQNWYWKKLPHRL